jgi:hypothetical protein
VHICYTRPNSTPLDNKINNTALTIADNWMQITNSTDNTEFTIQHSRTYVDMGMGTHKDSREDLLAPARSGTPERTHEGAHRFRLTMVYMDIGVGDHRYSLEYSLAPARSENQERPYEGTHGLTDSRTHGLTNTQGIIEMGNGDHKYSLEYSLAPARSENQERTYEGTHGRVGLTD